MDRFDFIIIGGGAAGFAAAIKASGSDASVAMVEAGVIGGTCVNVGCVPSKRLLTAGEVYYYGDHGFEGVDVEAEGVDLKKLVAQKDRLVLDLRRRKYANVIRSLRNVTLIRGRVRFTSRSEIDVDGRRIGGDKFLISTGSSPQILPIDGIDKVKYLTNVEALSLREVPESMVVIGGRALGLEFAQMYLHFGSKVTLLQRSPRIIPEEEPEISEALRGYLEEGGMEIWTGVEVKKVWDESGRRFIEAEIGGSARRFEAEHILMATGRRPNTAGLGLEKIGVEVKSDGGIAVDEEMHTSAPNIWAAGDVLGKPMLETVAAKEGAIAAENALFDAKRRMDFSAVPHAIFTSPQVASVGLTDAQAVEAGYECSCRVLEMKHVPKALILNDTRGLVKMVVERKTGRILGVHILSQFAAEMIHEAVLAVKYKLTVDDLIDTVHVFPTMTESLKLAAQSFRKDVSKLSCCTE